MWRPCNRRLFTTTARVWNTQTAETVIKTTADGIKGNSSCPMGTKLNLGVWKDAKKDPVAKADNEYPEWLWHIIPSEGSNEVKLNPLVKRSKDLRQLNRNQIKQNNYISELK
ncbi:large ribosomal subunit protein mL54 [Monosporozyma servazzii]